MIEYWLHERGEQFVRVGHPRRRGRRVGAHPASVGPGVPLPQPLVVLCERQCNSRGAVAEGNQGVFRAVQSLLDHELARGGHRVNCRAGLVVPLGNHYPLA